MPHKNYDREQAASLLPLLRSIAAEIDERSQDVQRLEALESALRPSARAHSNDLAELGAELALNRMEIERARRELERLGCAIDTLAPLALRIPARATGRPSSFVWSASDPQRLMTVSGSAA